MSLELPTVPTTIGDVKFETQKFAAFRAYELMGKIHKQLLASGVSPDTDLKKAGVMLDPPTVLEVLAGTRAYIVDDKGEERIVELNDRKKIDRVFSGKLNLKHMLEVLAHALEVNYGDFDEGSDPAESLPKAASES